EDGIRDDLVTGVQTCALPIYTASRVDRGRLDGRTEVLRGEDGILRMVTDPSVDVVVTAVVGAAGLAGTWAALEAGKTVAVANKRSEERRVGKECETRRGAV